MKNSNSKAKYIKYKTKYLKLKENLILYGGADEIELKPFPNKPPKIESPKMPPKIETINLKINFYSDKTPSKKESHEIQMKTDLDFKQFKDQIKSELQLEMNYSDDSYLYSYKGYPIKSQSDYNNYFINNLDKDDLDFYVFELNLGNMTTSYEVVAVFKLIDIIGKLKTVKQKIRFENLKKNFGTFLNIYMELLSKSSSPLDTPNKKYRSNSFKHLLGKIYKELSSLGLDNMKDYKDKLVTFLSNFKPEEDYELFAWALIICPEISEDLFTKYTGLKDDNRFIEAMTNIGYYKKFSEIINQKPPSLIQRGLDKLGQLIRGI